MLFKVLALVLAGVHLAVSTPAAAEGGLVERGVVERDVAVTHSGDGTSIASIAPGSCSYTQLQAHILRLVWVHVDGRAKAATSSLL